MKFNKKYLWIAVAALGMFIGLTHCDYRTPDTTQADPSVEYNLRAEVEPENGIIYADNGKSVARVQVSLRNVEQEPLANETINFSANSGLITSSAVTNSSGLATGTFDDKGDVQDSVQIVARFTDKDENTKRDTVYVTVLPISELVENIRFTEVGDVVVNNPTQSYAVPITAQILDNAPSPIGNVPVHFELVNKDDPLGTLSTGVDTSDGNGRATITFSSYPGVLGTVGIAANIIREDAESAMSKQGAQFDLSGFPKAANTIVFTDTLRFELVSPDPYTMVLVTDRDTIFVDGGQTVARIQAAVKDANNQPVRNASIQFSSTQDIGVINSPVKTDSSGVATATFRDFGDPDLTGTTTIQATYIHPYHGELSKTVNVTVKIREVHTSNVPASITIETDNIQLDHNTRSTQVRATVLDSSGENVTGNLPVFFSTDKGIIDRVSITENGTAVAGFSAGTESGTAIITATYHLSEDEKITGSTAIDILPGGLKYILLPPAHPNTIQVKDGGGQETTQLRAELYDSDGQLVVNPDTGNYNVKFELGQLHPDGANINNEGNSDVVEANNGIATATLNAGEGAGAVRVTASVATAGDSVISATTTPVVIEAGFPSRMIGEWDPSSLEQVGGGLYQIELAALVRDRYSNPVPDCTQVYWNIENDTMNVHIEGTSFTGNENENEDTYPGVAFTKLRFPTSLTFDSVKIRARTYSAPDCTDFVETMITTSNDSWPLLPFHPGEVGLAVDPGAWDFNTDGNPAEFTFFVSVQNSYGTPIPDAEIRFFADRNPTWIQGPVVFTDQNGQATAVGQYDETICPPIPNTDPTQYQTVDVTIYCQLMLPQQTTSNEVILTLARSTD